MRLLVIEVGCDYINDIWINFDKKMNHFWLYFFILTVTNDFDVTEIYIDKSGINKNQIGRQNFGTMMEH